jgi:hypothetical protein
MASLTVMTRRRVLAMLALLAAPSAVVARLSPESPARVRIVIRDGWILRASDIALAPSDAA